MAARRDHPYGVVFYRLYEGEGNGQVQWTVVREALEGIAKFLAEPPAGLPPFVLRIGKRGNGDGSYWVCLNDQTAASMFERLLTELAARVSRRNTLPDGSNPRLKALLALPEVPDAQSVPDAPALEEVPALPMEVSGGRRRIDFQAWSSRLSGLRGRIPRRRQKEA